VRPDEFAKILIDKLEHVQRSRELQDKLERKLMEVCIAKMFTIILEIQLILFNRMNVVEKKW